MIRNNENEIGQKFKEYAERISDAKNKRAKRKFLRQAVKIVREREKSINGKGRLQTISRVLVAEGKVAEEKRAQEFLKEGTVITQGRRVPFAREIKIWKAARRI